MKVIDLINKLSEYPKDKFISIAHHKIIIFEYRKNSLIEGTTDVIDVIEED